MQETEAQQPREHPGQQSVLSAEMAGCHVRSGSTDLQGDRFLAEINYDGNAAELQCLCCACAWAGSANALTVIESCSLTPGEPSPAGRCPECDALAYLALHPLERAIALIRELVGYETEKLDGTVAEQNVSGADLVDWFTSFRQRAKELLEQR